MITKVLINLTKVKFKVCVSVNFKMKHLYPTNFMIKIILIITSIDDSEN